MNSDRRLCIQDERIHHIALLEASIPDSGSEDRSLFTAMTGRY
jgi:hypothetical protein